MKNTFDSYKTTFFRLFDYNGRANRKEYWTFVLMNSLIMSLLALVAGWMGLGWLAGLCSMIALVPTLSVSIRRLHDTGRPGWWMALMLAPVIGQLILLVFFLSGGDSRPNAYGEAC